MTQATTINRKGATLRKLLTVLCGVALFVLLASFLAVWAVGRFAPKLLDASLAAQSGAHLAVEANDTNLFAGRVAFSGLTITNPGRWKEREFLRVRQLTLDVDLFSFFGRGTQHVRKAELDVERLTIVGKANFLTDNNAKDIGNGLKDPAPVSPAIPAGPSEPSRPYHIDHLRVRVDRITVIAGDGTPDRRVVFDSAFNYVFEAHDVTDRNFNAKVSSPMGKLALQTALEKQPALIIDLAKESVRKSVTEKLLEAK